MNKEQIINQARESLKLMVLQNMAGQEKALMNTAVDTFIKEKVSGMSSVDILDRFITPSDALNFFMSYLNERITSHFSAGIHNTGDSSSEYTGGAYVSA